MRKYTIPQSMEVEYFLSDHLGSTSLTTDAAGAKVSEIKYKPWGEVRSAWTSTAVTTPAYALTRQTFTGQYSYMDDPSTATTEGFGLMFYNSRMYDPALGRFTSADSIVPAGVQGLDRYAYVNNSPINFTDPTGHDPHWCDDAYCEALYSNRKLSRGGAIASVNLHTLKYYGNDKAAMEYATRSECTLQTCTKNDYQLFKAMMHKYNQHCGDGAWSTDCLNKFWGYIQGPLTADERNFPTTDSTTNMAAAILDTTGTAHGVFANDGQGCGTQDGGIYSFCDWANFTDKPDDPNDVASQVSAVMGCNAKNEARNMCYGVVANQYSFTVYYQGKNPFTSLDMYFVVMDVYNYQDYCYTQNLCQH